MLKLLKQIFLIFVSFQSVNNYQLMCKLCNKYQNKLIDFYHQNQDTLHSIFQNLCMFGSTQKFCDYYVNKDGKPLIKAQINFLQETDYLCANYFDLCDKKFDIFDYEKFKLDINKKYPQVQKEKTPKKNQVEFSNLEVLVLNDIHLDERYQYGSNKECKTIGGCCNADSGGAFSPDQKAGFWGSNDEEFSNCDIPVRFWNRTVQYIKETYPYLKVMFILGDISNHSYFKVPPKQVQQITEFFYRTIKENFPDVKVIPVLGNHECYPIDNFDFEHDNFVTDKIYPIYKQFLTNAQISDLKTKGFYEFDLSKNNLKVISINSQMFDLFNMPNTGSPNFQLQFFNNLASSLYESEQINQKVIVLEHIPYGDPYSNENWQKAYKIIIERFQDTVTATLGSHSHFDQLRFIHDSIGNVIHPVLVSPSLTTFDSYNPSYRMLQIRNGVLTDFEQYRFNLNYYNIKAEQGYLDFEYDLAYSFNHEYNVVLADRDSLKNFEQLLYTDDKLSDKYALNFMTKYLDNDLPQKKIYTICAVKETFYETYLCLREYKMVDITVSSVLVFRSLFIHPWIQKKINNHKNS